LPGKRRGVQPGLAGFACQKIDEARVASCEPRDFRPVGNFQHSASASVAQPARDPANAAVAFDQQDGFHV
jgi:hypothetical protein